MMEYKSTEEYVKDMVDNGFMSEDGEPLKCFKCESTELEDANIDRIEYGILEYDMRCKGCKTIVGHWAYGNWTL